MYGIPEDWGTACTVQAMVFGNLGEDCGTGVVFTRNPTTGARELFGEFLADAQGEDVVAGIRTPEPLARLQALMPEVHAALSDTCQKLERHFKDMQDIEFTVEQRRLWILQTRAGKRAARAMVKVAVDLVHEQMIAVHTLAAKRVKPAVDDSLRSTAE
jgi:pyruvate,orthophosphate dikinase